MFCDFGSLIQSAKDHQLAKCTAWHILSAQFLDQRGFNVTITNHLCCNPVSSSGILFVAGVPTLPLQCRLQYNHQQHGKELIFCATFF